MTPDEEPLRLEFNGPVALTPEAAKVLLGIIRAHREREGHADDDDGEEAGR